MKDVTARGFYEKLGDLTVDDDGVLCSSMLGPIGTIVGIVIDPPIEHEPPDLSFDWARTVSIEVLGGTVFVVPLGYLKSMGLREKSMGIDK